MADHAEDFRKAGFTQDQAVILGTKFEHIDKRFDLLEHRMGRLEERMGSLEGTMHTLNRTLMIGLPTLFIAQFTAIALLVG